MDHQSNVFSDKVEDKVVETPQEQPSSNDVFANQLASIKNEEGRPKYDSVEKALDALNHSQAYIPQLKTELQQKEEELAKLKEELDKRGSIDDVLKRLTAEEKEDAVVQEETPPSVPGLNEDSAKNLFEKMLSETKQKEQMMSNQTSVNEALVSRYGDKAAEVVAEKAKELGTTVEQLGSLASQSPKMVLALFNQGGSGQPKPTSSSRQIPVYNKPQTHDIERPSKSMLSGATGRDQAEYMRKIKESVYKKYNIEQ